MAKLRLSGPARADLTHILATSLERWGAGGQARYAALIAAALETIAADPAGSTTRDRAALLPGVRSFHLRHASGDHGVAKPVHLVYYRVGQAGAIEIARVLHERMEPSRHVTTAARPRRSKRRRRDE